MGAVSGMARTTGLAILDALPGGFLDCGARDLHLVLEGPALIELAGERGPPLFVSILLHGNEDSGLGAIQRVISDYQDRPLPRSLMLLVGNVEAACHGLRRLEGQPDYNRIWPGTPNHGDTAEARIMAEVHARAVERRAVAAIDLHNNTGRNPHYAVVCNLDPRTLDLAALFSRRVVCFRGIPGTRDRFVRRPDPGHHRRMRTAWRSSQCRCGSPPRRRSAQPRRVAGQLERRRGARPLPHVGVVRVREDVSFGFGAGEAELRFDQELDENNFRELKPGTVLGETDHHMPLRMIDEAGCDVAEHYFETNGGKLRLRKQAVPAMFTVEPGIVRQDCLGYLMERL